MVEASGENHASHTEERLPRPGERVADRYEIEHELGRGGMGAVYAARHIVTGKRVAIKWLLPSFGLRSVSVERFVREAKLATQVDHENIVEVHDVGGRPAASISSWSTFEVSRWRSGSPAGRSPRTN